MNENTLQCPEFNDVLNLIVDFNFHLMLIYYQRFLMKKDGNYIGQKKKINYTLPKSLKSFFSYFLSGWFILVLKQDITEQLFIIILNTSLSKPSAGIVNLKVLMWILQMPSIYE